jgi:ligand-binding sensor protein
MNANIWHRLVAVVAFCFVAGAASGQSDSPDGLVKVKSKQMELAWLLPGADFRPYTKVLVDKTQVAFRQNWMKNYNMNVGMATNMVTQADANQIMTAAQTNFDGIFEDAFRKAGYEVVTTTGPDVLRVNSGIVDLTVNAPLGMSTGQVSWIIYAGQAVLIVEVRDTMTNALLARVADRRATQDMGRQIASNATNLSDFRQLFSLWSGILVKGLAELKAVSPIHAKLTPNQQLRGN